MSEVSKGPHWLCAHPFLSLTLSPSGDYRTCSATRMDSAKISEASIDQAFHSKNIRHVRKLQLQGEVPENCVKCKQKEDRNLLSKRQRFTRSYLQRLQEHGFSDGEIQTLNEQPKLLHLDISFSNVCNMSCAMCSSEYSTSWFKLDQKALDEGLEFRNRTQAFMNKQTLPPEIISEIVDLTNQLESIIIKGGEPLADKACLDFLSQISKNKKRNPRLDIQFQTNGALVDQSFLDSIQGLNLELGVSIDGIDQTYEWIRGTKFKKILESLKVLNECPSVKNLYIDLTLSGFNVFNMPDFLVASLKMKKDFPKIKACTLFARVNQSYGSLRALPLDSRLTIADQCESIISESPEFFEDHESFLEHIREPQMPEFTSDFVRWVEFMNKTRGFSLEELDREMTKIAL